MRNETSVLERTHPAVRIGVFLAPGVLAAALLGGAQPAQAQVQRRFVNQSFEVPTLTAANAANGCYVQVDQSLVPNWRTTHASMNGSGNCTSPARATPGRLIEVWRDRFLGIRARNGVNFAELNAVQAARLYQAVCLVQGEQVGWQLSHRGRDSSTNYDVAQLKVGSTGSVVEVATTSNGTARPVRIFPGYNATATTSAPTNGWRDYSGTFIYPETTGITNIGFEAVSGATTGNFLDNVQMTLVPMIDFAGPNTSDLELDSGSNLRPNRPQLRINGSARTAFSVTIRITGGTAVRGTDYFTNTASGTSDVITINVPQGVYDGASAASLISLPIYVAGNTQINANKTITFAVDPPPAASSPYIVASNVTCGGPVQDKTEYTIVDDDAALAVIKRAGAPEPVNGSLTQFDIDYTIEVSNPSTSAVAKTYDLTDTPSFESDVRVDALTFLSCTPSGGANCGAGMQTAPQNTPGPWTLNTARTLAVGARDTYNLTVRFTIQPGQTGTDACGNGQRSGLTNTTSATITSPAADSVEAAACQSTPTPVWITLNKSLPAGRVDPTDQFQVYLDMAGVPLAGGSVATANGDTTASTGQLVVFTGTTLQFSESLRANGNGARQLPDNYTASVTCTGSASAPNGPGTPAVAPEGGTGGDEPNELLWPAFTPQPGEAIECTIVNTAITYDVTATAGMGGSVNGGSLQCNPSPVFPGGSSQCTAAPAPGYRFAGWEGSCAGQGAVCDLTNVNADQSSHANFAPLPGSLTVTKEIVGGPAQRAATSFSVTATCTSGSQTSSVTVPADAASASVTMSGIPAGDSCTVEEGALPPSPDPNYSWGTPSYVQPAGAMAPGGTLSATVTNTLVRNQVSVTLSKTVTGAPSGGAPGSYSFSLICDTGTYTGSIALAGAATTGSTTVTVPQGANCSALNETSKPAAPANYSWGQESTVPPASPIANGAQGSITNPLTRNQIAVAITKTVTGAPATGAPGDYGFSLVCDTGTYAGVVSLVGNATTGSASVDVPQGASCSALNETSKAPAPAGYSWGQESTTPPVGAIDDNSNGSITNPLQAPALTLAKSADPASAAQGENITYTIRVSNGGPVASAANTTITDPVPAGLTVVSTTSGTGWACDDTVRCVRATGVAAGAMDETVVTVVATKTSTANVTNTAQVSSGDVACEADPPAPRCTASATVVDTSQPVLTLAKSAAPTSAAQGENITYTIRVSNSGPVGSAADTTITDPVPAGLAVVSAIGGTGWACDDTVRCVKATGVAAGATDEIVVTVVATKTSTTSVTNTASVTSGDAACEADPPAARCAASATVVDISQPVLTLAKSADPTSAAQGETITYTIRVSNSGPVASAADTAITDTVPAGLALVSVTGGTGWACDDTIRCVKAAGVAAGTVDETVVTVMATKTGTTSVTNTARVTSGDAACEADPPATRCTASATVVDISQPVLTVTKSADPASAAQGETITYTIRVSNSGPVASAADSTITDLVPAGLALTSVTGGTGWVCDETIRCVKATGVAAGTVDETVVTVVATKTSAASVTNTAQMSSGDAACEADPPAPRCTASATVVDTSRPVLALAKSADPTSAAQGENVTYTIRISNSGPVASAPDTTITDAVPAGLALVSVTGGTGWVCDDTIRCVKAAGVAAGAADEIVVTVVATKTGTASVTNTARVASGDAACEADPPAPRCTASATVVDISQPLLTLAKSADPASAAQGENITYTIRVSNSGPVASATDTTITDPVPAGLVLVSVTGGTGWACDKTIRCVKATGVAAGAVDETVVNVVATKTSTASVTNTARVASGDAACEADPPAARCTASATVVDSSQPVLALAKSADPASAAQGENVTYTIRVSNSGPVASAIGTTIADPVPAGLAVVSATGGIGWICDDTVRCVKATGVAAGTVDETVVNVVATKTSTASVTNTASVTSGDAACEADPPAARCAASATVVDVSQPALALFKTADRESARRGDTIHYTIHVSNSGPASSGVDTTIVDNVPLGLSVVSVRGGDGWACVPGSGDGPVGIRCVKAAGVEAGTAQELVVEIAAVKTGSSSVTNTADVTRGGGPGCDDPTAARLTPQDCHPSASATVVDPDAGALTPVPIASRTMLAILGLLLLWVGVTRHRARQD